MEQKDYLLREIEKIGLILNAIRQKLFGGKDDLSITLENQVETAKGMLLNEINFDLDKFLNLNVENSNEYICSFEGFNVENIELLAEYIFQIAIKNKSEKHFEKSLQLYELCNLKSKTYSLERETNMKIINQNIVL